MADVSLEVTGSSAITLVVDEGLGDAPNDGQYYARHNQSWAALGGMATVNDAPSDGTTYGRNNAAWVRTTTGSVTSVALTAPASILSVSGSPVTTAGTLALSLATQAANLVWAGPTTGAAATPTFRSLVAADIPALGYVTSVALAMPGQFTVSGSPVTSSGTLTAAWQTQTANTFLSGPASAGPSAPTFRTIVSADINAALTTPGPIGGTTANVGSFTNLNISGVVFQTSTFAEYIIAETATTNAFRWTLNNDGSFRMQTSTNNFVGIVATPFYMTTAGRLCLNSTTDNGSDQLQVLGTIQSILAATNDSIRVSGRAGGTGSWIATITTGALTASRTFTLPDAASNPVQPSTAAAHQFATAISAAGVITWTQPTSGDISGLGTMATQNANAVAITGGTIDGATVGGTTPAAGTFKTPFTIDDATDITKQWGLSLSGMTAGTKLTVAGQQSTSQTLNYPNITATDTLVTLGLAQTFTAAQSITSAAPQLTVNGSSGQNAAIKHNAPTGQDCTVQYYVNSVIQYNLHANTTTFYINDNVNSLTWIQYTAGAIGAGFVTFANTTVSSSVTTGSVVVAGGIGASGNLWVGGTGNFASTLNANGSAGLIITQATAAGGTRQALTISPAANTSIASGTESPAVLFNSATRQWATSTPTTQEEWKINAPTYACDTASQTITTAVTFAIQGAPSAGTNVTITTPLALWVRAGQSTFAGQVNMTGVNSLILTPATGGGIPIILKLTGAANTAVTSGTECPDVNFILNRTVQWATSTPATQRAVLIAAPTYACDTASQTITTASTVAITGAPAAGSNVTITTGYALNVQAGDCLFGGNAYCNNYLSWTNAINSFNAAFTKPILYSTGTGGGAYPFLEAGNFILSPRISGATRDFIVATGATPLFALIVNRSQQCILGPGTGTGGTTAPAANTFAGNLIWGRNTAAADTAGAVGETLDGSGTTSYTNYTTTATYQQVDTVSLTAGKWLIIATGTFSSAGATLTASTSSIFTISNTTASASGTTEGSGDIVYVPSGLSSAVSEKQSVTLRKVVNISATASYYLNSQSTFTLGNPQFVGSIHAVRLA